MSRYNKLWVSLLGTAVILASESGVVSAGQAETLMSSGVALLTSFGVYMVPNRD